MFSYSTMFSCTKLDRPLVKLNIFQFIRLKDDWDSGIEEILEASAFNNEDRITQYEYDFKPYMKEFKHLYSRRNKVLLCLY